MNYREWKEEICILKVSLSKVLKESLASDFLMTKPRSLWEMEREGIEHRSFLKPVGEVCSIAHFSISFRQWFSSTQKCVSERVRKIREFSLRTKVCWFVFKLLRRQRDNSFFGLYLELLNCLRCCLVQLPAFFKWGLKRESKAEATQYPFCASSLVVEFWVLRLTKTL